MNNNNHKIAILSDTHGLLRGGVMEILKACDIILHGGDIGPLKLLEEIKAINTVYAVCGNNDREYENYLPKDLKLELFGIKFYMVHDKKQAGRDLDDADVIICGHSHKFEEHYDGNKLWLNPGSCGPRRFGLPVTMAVLEISEGEHNFKVRRLEFDIPGI